MEKFHDEMDLDYDSFPSVEDADEMEEECEQIFSRFCDN